MWLLLGGGYIQDMNCQSNWMILPLESEGWFNSFLLLPSPYFSINIDFATAHRFDYAEVIHLYGKTVSTVLSLSLCRGWLLPVSQRRPLNMTLTGHSSKEPVGSRTEACWTGKLMQIICQGRNWKGCMNAIVRKRRVGMDATKRGW